MLLLHHNPDGAPGRTRTDEYEFTKLALLLLRHRGKLASTAGIAPAASTFARWRSDLTELRGQMASVIGLASIRPDLKGRLRELLCIHGQKWSPRLVSRQRLLVFSEALICLSYSGEMVVPAGNAPASSGYQPGALLLSYRTSSSCGFKPNRRIGRKTKFGFGADRTRVIRFGL